MVWAARKSVIVPVDFSDESLAAVSEALQLVDCAEHLHVVHVLPILEPTEPSLRWTIDDAGRQLHAQQALDERIADLCFAGCKKVVLFGDPGHEIADYAQSVAADLIVMPSHGRTGIKRLLIGSVAERVIRLSHCPVLVLRQ